jgi:hypothetical protein
VAGRALHRGLRVLLPNGAASRAPDRGPVRRVGRGPGRRASSSWDTFTRQTRLSDVFTRERSRALAGGGSVRGRPCAAWSRWSTVSRTGTCGPGFLPVPCGRSTTSSPTCAESPTTPPTGGSSRERRRPGPILSSPRSGEAWTAAQVESRRDLDRDQLVAELERHGQALVRALRRGDPVTTGGPGWMLGAPVPISRPISATCTTRWGCPTRPTPSSPATGSRASGPGWANASRPADSRRSRSPIPPTLPPPGCSVGRTNPAPPWRRTRTSSSARSAGDAHRGGPHLVLAGRPSAYLPVLSPYPQSWTALDTRPGSARGRCTRHGRRPNALTLWSRATRSRLTGNVIMTVAVPWLVLTMTGSAAFAGRQWSSPVSLSAAAGGLAARVGSWTRSARSAPARPPTSLSGLAVAPAPTSLWSGTGDLAGRAADGPSARSADAAAPPRGRAWCR